MKQILVIEDDLDIQELLFNFLKEAGYAVTLAGDGVEGLMQFRKQKYDLILLDILMPKIDGYGVLELIRMESNVPIVILTALDAEENQIKGFDLKADDYITKPFSMKILLRKIHVILRRVSTKDEDNAEKVIYKSLSLDIEGYRTYISGQEVELTQKEFEVLKELIANQGRVITREMLLNRLWDYDFYGDLRVVDTHIKNLRKKLNVDYIETIRGVGYRVDKEN